MAQHRTSREQNIANPTSLILSAAMLLEWRGQRDANDRLVEGARLIERAVDQVLDDPALRTRDVGGTHNTDAFTASVVAAITKVVPSNAAAGAVSLKRARLSTMHVGL